MAASQEFQREIQVDSLEEAHEAIYRLGWTDGLPAIPPTAKLVNAALDHLGRDPQEVIGEVPPKNRIATVEKVFFWFFKSKKKFSHCQGKTTQDIVFFLRKSY